MKLKAITYALMYGRNPNMLKRTEGARRVKQAIKLIPPVIKPRKNSNLYLNGKFAGTKVRTVGYEAKRSKLSLSEWLQNSTDSCLGIERVLFVEGDLDRMKVNELGYKTCN
ncbi:conserved hypothetical protein [Vibrio phage 501E54-1]|nr:conserved hypothetical protein [Vibrio phage 501E54-1]